MLLAAAIKGQRAKEHLDSTPSRPARGSPSPESTDASEGHTGCFQHQFRRETRRTSKVSGESQRADSVSFYFARVRHQNRSACCSGKAFSSPQLGRFGVFFSKARGAEQPQKDKDKLGARKTSFRLKRGKGKWQWLVGGVGFSKEKPHTWKKCRRERLLSAHVKQKVLSCLPIFKTGRL